MSDALDRLERVSAAVARVLRRNPDLVPSTVLPSREALLVDAVALIDEALEDPSPDVAMARCLRRLKYRVVGGLILRDLDDGPDGAEAIATRVSWLADALCEAALQFADRRLASKHGRPPEWRSGGGFVVFALGKHGGEELNYSSDIDVILITDDVSGRTPGPAPLDGVKYAERLARQMVSLLQERTADGFCFRVDLDLRPDGVAGPTTVTAASAEQYYLTWGRTWERAAWLKARVCAGDADLGADLLERLAPFRYRRSMDFATLEDIALLRDRIASAARRVPLEQDLKRGPGGIRELEFFLQALQLVWAGRDAQLRLAGAMPALRALTAQGVLPDGVDPEPLAAAWRLLRAVEHRLQWPEEAQTQRLPTDDEGWLQLANAFDQPELSTPDALRSALARARETVQDAWNRLMLRGEQAEEPTDAVDPFASTQERVQTLARLGFDKPQAAARRIGELAHGGRDRRMSQDAWRRFQRVTPRLVDLAARSQEPDVALARLSAFLQRVGARGTTFALLQDNPGVAETLIRLFARSAHLSELFVAHPELLDALVLRGRGGEQPPQTEAVLWDRMQAEIAARPDGDDAMLAMRTLRTSELLRIGLADLAGSLPDDGLPNRWLSALAAALVRGAATLGLRTLEARHGRPRRADGGAPLAVIGLGSLGSGWMTYGSDLDLAFVWGGAEGESDGPKPIDGRRWASRWSQRLVTALTAPTREGTCYEVDLRMRPDGSGGSVVGTLDGFADYYAVRARPFEKLALCRARVVATTSDGFEAECADVLAGALAVADPIQLVAEAREMRRRQLQQLGPVPAGTHPLKRGRGGLADLEFALATMQCTRPADHAARRAPDPLDALGHAQDEGVLTPSEGACAGDAWRLLRRVEGQLRLRSGQGADRLVLPSEQGSRVASALGTTQVALGRDLDGARACLANVSEGLMRQVESGR
jgi:[glutamine synthetase] adenylyltransferase / [glutamine synthetase]-adenylyl-L-tyrosine phosphorylase